MKLPGKGLAEGLAVTARVMTQRTVTREYPDVKPDLPPRSRGVIGLVEENCTVCMLCARECPCWCIYIDSHKETIPPSTEGGRARSRNVLDRFAFDWALCMYCGICVDACPFEALYWSPEFEYSDTDILGLTHERERLVEWAVTAPPPPAVVANSELPKEAAPARPAGRERPARRTDEAAPAPQSSPPPDPSGPTPPDA